MVASAASTANAGTCNLDPSGWAMNSKRQHGNKVKSEIIEMEQRYMTIYIYMYLDLDLKQIS